MSCWNEKKSMELLMTVWVSMKYWNLKYKNIFSKMAILPHGNSADSGAIRAELGGREKFPSPLGCLGSRTLLELDLEVKSN